MIEAEASRTTRRSEPAGDSRNAQVGFADFYAAHYGQQLRRASVLARTPDAAADAVHEAFVDVYRNWSRLDHPAGYLARAVVNRCRDDGRQASARERLHLRLLSEPAGETHQAPTADDELWDSLIALPFNQRAAVALRYLDGHTEAEIAELLNCPQGSVGPWIRRGLDRMRRSIVR